MAGKYKIRAGFSFVGALGVAVGGDIIELDDDVAALHAHKLEPVDVPKQKASKPPKSTADSKDPGAGGATGGVDGKENGEGSQAGGSLGDTDPAA